MTRIIDVDVFKFLVYVYLNKGEVRGFRQIAQEMNMNKYKLSRILERLETEGLLIKDVSGFPRRGSYKLTEKGMEAAKLIYKLMQLLGNT
jgi:DNA-binding HxlR family transcriptional regulator